MKKMITLFMFLSLALCLQSCGGLAAGVVNRGYLEKDTEQYAATKVAQLKPLKLSEEQEDKVEQIAREAITDLKQNAHKEKTKEISNKASLNNIRYYWYRAEVKLQNVLDQKQLAEYLSNDMYGGFPKTAKEIARERKKLKKMGYAVDFQ